MGRLEGADRVVIEREWEQLAVEVFLAELGYMLERGEEDAMFVQGHHRPILGVKLG